MPVIAKLCAVILFVMLIRCPLVGQQVCARLAAKSVDCTSGNRNILSKSFDRNRMLRDQGKTYLSLGVQYNRAVALCDPDVLTIERESRLGLPLLAGYRLGRCSLEAGAFFGVNMWRAQESAIFANTELHPLGNSRLVDPTATVMLGVGFEFSKSTRLNLSYTHLDRDDLANSVLGNVQLGWSLNL